MSTPAFNRQFITSAYRAGTRQAQNERVLSCLAYLRNSHADDRLGNLKLLNPGMTDFHLEKIVDATARWLDHHARDRMRATARKQQHTSRDPMTEIMLDWLTEEELDRLWELMEHVGSPERTLEICYAVCEAENLARAVYLIHQARLRPQVDPTLISQSPEEVNDDLDFVNAR